MAGKLYVCATPIGNLQDVTLRLLRVLAETDLVACEDTRRTRKLLTHHGISAKVVSYHEGNEARQAELLARKIDSGKSVALVTDAGMPTLSDPGYRLVRACIERGLSIEVIPGPSSITAALAIAGLPTDRFVFEGFMPQKQSERRRRLETLLSEERTIVYFESPQRLLESLKDAALVLGDRLAAIARELTKVHEEVLRGRLNELISAIKNQPVLGEIVVILQGAEPVRDQATAIEYARDLVNEEGMKKSKAASTAAARYGVTKRVVYDALTDPRG